MAKIDTYEYIFEDTYPSGSTEARLIDDIFRAEKEALYNRLDQEHYWRRLNDTEYDWHMEGGHRPESGRVWGVTHSPGTTLYPGFPTYASHMDKALFAVVGDASDADDTGYQWIGTLWYAEGETLVPAIRRFRGKVRFNGIAHFSKENYKMSGTSAGSFDVNEGNPERGSNTPSLQANNITLVPFHTLTDSEWGPEIEDEGAKTSLVWPIRVGNFNAVDGTFTEVVGATTEGLALLVGNYPSGDGVAYVFTRRGLEVYASGDDVETVDITFNGISLRKHDHSGGMMGSGIASTPVDPKDDEARSTWFKEVGVLGVEMDQYLPYWSGGGGVPPWHDSNVVEGGAGSIYPTGEDMSLIPISITVEAIFPVAWITDWANQDHFLHFQLRVKATSTSEWTVLRQSSVPFMLYQDGASVFNTVHPSLTWLLSPGELPESPHLIQVRGVRCKYTLINGSGSMVVKVLGWRR